MQAVPPKKEIIDMMSFTDLLTNVNFSRNRRKSADPQLLPQHPGCTFCIATPSTRAMQQDRCAPWAVPGEGKVAVRGSRSTAAPPCRRSRDAARRERWFRQRHSPRSGAGCERTWEDRKSVV